MAQTTVAITTIIHTKPILWDELLDRVARGETTYLDYQALAQLRTELAGIAATYPGHEYFTHLARLLGLHQQMSPGQGEVEDAAYMAAEASNPELLASVRDVERMLLRRPIILGGEA